MGDYDPGRYGEDWAEDYDALFDDLDQWPTVDAVAELAGGGRVLEFGIGTGRLALPLAARGVEVVGVEASQAMVSALRRKPGGDRLEVVMGDFAHATADGGFAVVLLAFNTLFALPHQEAQLACFANAARHLTPGGVFALDAFVPDLTRFQRGQRLETRAAEPNEVRLEASRHDPVGQRVTSTVVRLSAVGARLLPVAVRYAWPAELDLMARLAGLRLRERWQWWDGSTFTSSSGQHVSIYERPV